MKVSYHPEEFGGYSHSGSEDIMFLVCHMISQEHWSKGHVTGPEPLTLNLNLVNLTVHLWSTKHAILTHAKFQDVDIIFFLCVERKTSEIGHTCLRQKLTKSTQKKLLVGLSRDSNKRENVKCACSDKINFFMN